MTQDEVVGHWRKGAKEALTVALLARSNGIYTLALFHCHLAVEKWLKSLFVAANDSGPPKTHNLRIIANAIGRPWSKIDLDMLSELSKYAVAARYDDLLWMDEEATEEKADLWIKNVQSFIEST